MKAINEHRGPLVFRRHVATLTPTAVPKTAKSAARKKDAESPPAKVVGKTLAEDPVTSASIAAMLGMGPDTLTNLDGSFKDMGAYTLVCSCDCKKCLWSMLEIRIVPIELAVDVDYVEVLLGTEFSFTNDAMQAKAEAADVVESKANLAAQDAWHTTLKSTKLKEQAGSVEIVRLVVSGESRCVMPGTPGSSAHIGRSHGYARQNSIRYFRIRPPSSACRGFNRWRRTHTPRPGPYLPGRCALISKFRRRPLQSSAGDGGAR
jgi:hypothetical protein